MTSVELLFSKAIDPETVRIDPHSSNYTIPHTWGVYEILGNDCGPSGKRYRKGNHPVRHQELMYEFGQVKRLALFDEDALSIDLASRLNNTMMVSRK